jgi:hypothetical protein
MLIENRFANRIGYSDVTPYEVIKTISEKTIEVRQMACVADKSVKLDFQIGGFAANCSNQNYQKWIITSDFNAPIIRIRQNKKGWMGENGSKFQLGIEPIRFYDYNF